MIKMSSPVYICDVCGKEFTDPLAVYDGEIMKYGGLPGFKVTGKKKNNMLRPAPVARHLCTQCHKRITDILAKNGIRFIDDVPESDLYSLDEINLTLLYDSHSV